MESAVFKDFCANLGIRTRYISPYHHQSNPVERANRTLVNLLRTAEKSDEWDSEALSAALFAYRSSVHSSLGTSPYTANFGRAPRLPIDLKFPTEVQSPKGLAELTERLGQVKREIRSTMTEAAKAQKRAYDKRKGTVTPQFSVGQRVYWKIPNRSKLDPVWDGPFLLDRQMDDVTWSLAGASGSAKTVHVNQLKECYDDKTPLKKLRGRGRPKKEK